MNGRSLICCVFDRFGPWSWRIMQKASWRIVPNRNDK